MFWENRKKLEQLLIKRYSSAFENEKQAIEWLTTPNPYFFDVAPINYATNDSETVAVLDDFFQEKLGITIEE